MVDPRGLEVAADWQTLQSPETYVGYNQSTGFAQEGVAGFDEPRNYTLPGRLGLNQWGLSGNWTVAGHAALLNERGGRVAFRFHARVAGTRGERFLGTLKIVQRDSKLLQVIRTLCSPRSGISVTSQIN